MSRKSHITELLSTINTSFNIQEKVNVSSVEKEVDSIVKSLNVVDESLYKIASELLKNDMYDVRKDILTFIASINDMYNYLKIDMMTKINPTEEVATEEK